MCARRGPSERLGVIVHGTEAPSPSPSLNPPSGGVAGAARAHALPRLVVILAVVLVLEEQVLVAAVGGEGHRRDAQAREGALEAVPSRKGARVAPGLPVSDVIPRERLVGKRAGRPEEEEQEGKGG